MKVQQDSATLTIPDWLAPLWPVLPSRHWPSFCGSGDGIGDFVVPDYIRGVCVAPACFIHDVEWAVSDGTYRAFQRANDRMLKNLIALVVSELSGWIMVKSIFRSILYWIFVSSRIGWRCYEPCGAEWQDNPVVKSRLKKLHLAVIKHIKRNLHLEKTIRKLAKHNRRQIKS